MINLSSLVEADVEERSTDIDRQIKLLVLKGILLLLLKEAASDLQYAKKIDEFYGEVIPYLGGWKFFKDPPDVPPDIG